MHLGGETRRGSDYEKAQGYEEVLASVGGSRAGGVYSFIGMLATWVFISCEVVSFIRFPVCLIFSFTNLNIFFEME